MTILFICPFAIRTAGDVIRPIIVIQIPLNGFANAGFKGFCRLPAQFALQLTRINRIAAVMPLAVCHKLNETLRFAKLAEDCPDYLFDIMKGDKKRKEEAGYKEYQSALRRFNNQLKSLSRELHIKSPVTSYTIRHSWATSAKYQGIPIEMISESLGHKSIKTTQIYLKGFELRERTEVNKGNLSYIRNYRLGR